MKKSLLLLLLCAGILTGCGNQALPAEPTETSTVSQTTTAVQTAENEITTTTTTEGIPEVTETCSEVISSVTTVTETNTATEEIPNDTKSTTTTAAVQEEESPAVQSTTTRADDEPAATTKITTTTKPIVTTKVTTTTKPATTTKVTTTTRATTTTKVTTTAPIQTTTTATTTSAADYYHEIGRSLSHDGTDYGKAKAVYDWMIVNGHGTCVNYSYQTYLVCEGIGLECYGCWTAKGIYGHTANVVKVNGIWFVLDTQGQGFLLNNDCGFTEIIDKNENHVADASIISSQRYDELFE